jgi:DNA-binding IclR family transcriptional regulator
MEAPPTGPILGGKPTQFTLDRVIATLRDAGGPLRPQELRARMGCGESTIHRLLQEGLAGGAITRAAPGAYALTDAPL